VAKRVPVPTTSGLFFCFVRPRPCRDGSWLVCRGEYRVGAQRYGVVPSIQSRSGPTVPSQPRGIASAGQERAATNPRNARRLLSSTRTLEFNRLRNCGELRTARPPVSGRQCCFGYHPEAEGVEASDRGQSQTAGRLSCRQGANARPNWQTRAGRISSIVSDIKIS
jgi:hypothetical protein